MFLDKFNFFKDSFNFLFFQGTPCDLITGEERRLVSPDKEPSNHVACTVEMTGVNIPCESEF